MDSIAYRAAAGDLEPRDGRVIAAVGLHVAVYAKTMTALMSPGDRSASAGCDAMTADWFALRDALRDTVRGRAASDLSPQLADLSVDLVRTFGPPSAPDPRKHGDSDADLATAFRGLVNRLPGLARDLATAAARWGTEALPPALDPSTPIGWRDRTGIERYVGVYPTRLSALVATGIAAQALRAARDSAVVATQADRSAVRLGYQPHPQLVKAHINDASTTALTPDSTPEVRWHAVVASIDERLCRDAVWPGLARVLDRAALAGWDVDTQLPDLARDLPTRQAAAELTYRVLERCPIEAATVADHHPAAHVRVEHHPNPAPPHRGRTVPVPSR